MSASTCMLFGFGAQRFGGTLIFSWKPERFMQGDWNWALVRSECSFWVSWAMTCARLFDFCQEHFDFFQKDKSRISSPYSPCGHENYKARERLRCFTYCCNLSSGSCWWFHSSNGQLGNCKQGIFPQFHWSGSGMVGNSLHGYFRNPKSHILLPRDWRFSLSIFLPCSICNGHPSMKVLPFFVGAAYLDLPDSLPYRSDSFAMTKTLWLICSRPAWLSFPTRAFLYESIRLLSLPKTIIPKWCSGNDAYFHSITSMTFSRRLATRPLVISPSGNHVV